MLYLPYNEIHELALIYLNFEILSKGYKTIYLGQSIPLENLVEFSNYFENTIFLSYWSVFPEVEQQTAYIEKFQTDVISDSKSELWIIGKMTKFIDRKKLNHKTLAFSNIQELLNKL